jgi:tetratricopeptide (TPR) repeat protein
VVFGDFSYFQGRFGAVLSIRPCVFSASLLLLCVACVCTFSTRAIGQTAATSDTDLVAQASAARMQNDVPRAIDLYSQALQQNPKWADGWWFLGSLQYGAGEYIPARDALSRYIELTPNAGPAFALRGLCEFEIGDFRKSLIDIEHGISLGAANQPRNEQILRYHQAVLLTRLGNYEGALKAYSFFAKNGITNPELQIAIGLAGLRMPLLPHELASDQQELASATGDAGYRFLAGDETSAGQAFQALFQRFPNAPNAHFFYGYLLFATDPDAALPEFQEELKLSPSNADANVMAAWALLMRNGASDALPYAQNAVAKDASLPAAQLVLGRSLLETGDVKGGMDHLEKALQLEPDNIETHLALAKAYSKSGRKEDARRERMLCLRLSSGNDSTEHP